MPRYPTPSLSLALGLSTLLALGLGVPSAQGGDQDKGGKAKPTKPKSETPEDGTDKTKAPKDKTRAPKDSSGEDKSPEGKTGKEKKPTAGKPKGESVTASWYKDADCRLVFFATLEGLYKDGISNEIVDLIIGKTSTLKNKVKHDFVFRCKLCHAVYEAFALYRNRPDFNGSSVNTFKKGVVSEEVKKALASDQASTRVYAMGALVKPWIKAKLLTLELDPKERKAFTTRLLDLVAEGNELIAEARRKDPDYGDDWRFYGSCQACKAVEAVSQTLERKK